MNIQKKNINRSTYEWETETNRDRIAKLRISLARYDDDADRAKRLEKCECKFCYYYMTSRIGGAACSQRPCGLCKAMIYSGSTNVDVLCHACGKERGMCARCGGDLEMKVRRKVDFTPVTREP
jgi:hypothetical protein